MANNSISISRIAYTLAVLLAVSGCTTESQIGDTTVFSFALWLPGVTLLGAATSFFVGMLIRTTYRWGWTLIVIGLIAGVIFAPSLFMDKATVNNEEFTLRTGFWFAPTTHEVRFGDVSTITYVEEVRASRRGNRTSCYLVCEKKSGGNAKVPVNDLMKNGAAARILKFAKERGVPIAERI